MTFSQWNPRRYRDMSIAAQIAIWDAHRHEARIEDVNERGDVRVSLTDTLVRKFRKGEEKKLRRMGIIVAAAYPSPEAKKVRKQRRARKSHPSWDL